MTKIYVVTAVDWVGELPDRAFHTREAAERYQRKFMKQFNWCQSNIHVVPFK